MPALLVSNCSIQQLQNQQQSGTPSSSPNHNKISYDDIEDELCFWETYVVCYVLGVNPPLHVIDGFVKRIWNVIDIEKIGTIAKGIFLVRLKSTESLAKAYESNGILFDKKPFIVQPWTKTISYEMETLS